MMSAMIPAHDHPNARVASSFSGSTSGVLSTFFLLFP